MGAPRRPARPRPLPRRRLPPRRGRHAPAVPPRRDRAGAPGTCGPAPRLGLGAGGARQRTRVGGRPALPRAIVVEARRAIDLLRRLPAIDGERVGFVGWSAGARHGAILAGVERRLRALVLVAGGAAPVSAYIAAAPPSLREKLGRLLRAVDPLRWVARARPGTLFFQNGRRDEVVPRDALERLAAAAPQPQRVRWYDARHRPTARMVGERNRWLLGRLSR